MPHVRLKALIRFLISLFLVSLALGPFLLSHSAFSQGQTILTDDFNDNSLDTAKWNPNSLFSGYIDLNIPIIESGQRLEIGPLLQGTPDSHYRGIRSVNTYNFSGAYSYVELVQPASSATTADAMFTVGNDVNNYYRLYVNAGTLYGLRKIGGTKPRFFRCPMMRSIIDFCAFVTMRRRAM